MKHDVYFYEFLSEAHDALVQRACELETLKRNLSVMESEDVYSEAEKDELRERIGEAYLAIDYADTLFADLSSVMDKVKLLSMFLSINVDDRAFNLVYEDMETY